MTPERPNTDLTATRIEQTANRARDALAHDLTELDERAKHAIHVAERGERAVRRASPSVPVVVGAALGLIGIGTAGSGGFLLRIVGRAASGAVAGLLAGAVMNQVHTVWSAAESRLHERRREGGAGPRRAEGEAPTRKPATVKAAEAVAGPLSEGDEKRAASVAHYAMAATTGVLYEMLARTLPLTRLGRGLAYGAAVWLIADEVTVPLLRLSSPPWEFPVKTHVRALLAHLVYGVVLDSSLAAMRRALPRLA